MAGTLYSVTYFSVTCARNRLCGEGENNLSSVSDYPVTRNEYEKALRKVGWSKTVEHGWLCPECRGDYVRERRALVGGAVRPTPEEGKK